MTLTEDQRLVVELDGGRHLVMAPPGSGKTEMLSQRVLRAVKSGVNPDSMLCATFTNRAAFEMRDRVSRDGGGMTLPEVGNLHHFCHRFLISVGRLSPVRHVLDEVEQIAFVREVVEVLRSELEYGSSMEMRRTHGVSVLQHIRGMVDGVTGEIVEARRMHVAELLEAHFSNCRAAERSPYSQFLSAVQISHQRRIGMPGRFLRRMDDAMRDLDYDGVVRAVERAYTALKRKFGSIDFDDLLNETYLWLESHPLADDQRYRWVQIDEVQDLNAIQWRIVDGFTAANAVSVYFGDVEQSIFSFLGASERCFREAVRGCERHYFATNFRATPLLLEVLMRYSLSTLRSDWDFLPAPSDLGRHDGELEFVIGGFDEAIGRARSLLDFGTAENVALLVRRNHEADILEESVRQTGYRYAKVSGVDVFSTALMRDFLAFVSLFSGKVSRTGWVSLLQRFAKGIGGDTDARYFVRAMFAAGFDPMTLFESRYSIPRLPHHGNRAAVWAWAHRSQLSSFRKSLRMAYGRIVGRLNREVDFDRAFEDFLRVAQKYGRSYSLHQLWPERFAPEADSTPELFREAHAHAVERVGKFLRYVRHVYRDDGRGFGQILNEDWDRLIKLKEADLLVGDEKIVISTVHKAKGRQFDAVVIPDAKDLLRATGGDPDEQARLLYVAISRAKRHLTVIAGEPLPEMDMLRQCLTPRYVSYYVRRATNVDVAGDWLGIWEWLAALNRQHECSYDLIARHLKSSFHPITRMAVKVLRHHSDADQRRHTYLEMLDSCVCPDVVVDCMRECRIYDGEAMERVRQRHLSIPHDRHLRYAAFHYFEDAARSALGTCAIDGDGLRNSAVMAIVDFLYSIDGDLRVQAANALHDIGDKSWTGKIFGHWSDFEQLAAWLPSTHVETVRKLLRNARCNPYRDVLAKMLMSGSGN